MKRIYLILSLLLIFSIVGNAQQKTIALGYCDGEVYTNATVGTRGSDKWIQGAIYIPNEKLAVYNGCHIDSLHVGLASRNHIDSLRVWIRHELTGADMANGAVKTVHRGWNTVALDNSYTIPANSDGLYIGFAYHQNGSAYGLSVIGNPHRYACYTDRTGSWEDCSAEGMLALEAFVNGNAMTQMDMKLKSVSYQPTFVINNDTLHIEATVRNIGPASINGFDVNCNIDGLDGTITKHFEHSLDYGDEYTAVFSITPDIASPDPVYRNMTISAIPDGGDADTTDNALPARFEVVNYSFNKKVLVEEFTTEKCVNCPRVANWLSQILAEDKYKDRVNAVGIHVGYETDWLTQSFENDYLWFYNANSSYAPAMMTDRRALVNETTPVFLPQSKEQIGLVLDSLLNESADVSVDLRTQIVHDATDSVRVIVRGKCSKPDVAQSASRVCVMLVENNIQAQHQSGSNAFIHQHVLREVNSTWGDVINWNGDEYSYTCELPLQSNYNRDQLQVIAFVWDYNPDAADKCKVFNSEKVDLTDMTDGIENVVSNRHTPTVDKIYTIDGRCVSDPVNGLNIIRHSDGTVTKVMIRK